MNTPDTPSVPWSASLKTISMVLGSAVRWMILSELGLGELVSVSLLAKKVGLTRAATSMHMRILKDAGIIQSDIGRLYRLVPALRPGPGAEYLDLGHCRVRLPVTR